ncbi:MAG: hypothetical protein JWO05_3840 [Gemmatimonadetes bacterium]|nr:hypothetical protein [Gemmatimonadota bacterium]
MSVLVQNATFVMRRAYLDATLAGGADVFVAEFRRQNPPERLVCADDQLVSISGIKPDEIHDLMEEFSEQGLNPIEHEWSRDGWVRLHCTDGLHVDCSWIAFERCDDDIAHCWIEDAPKGERVVPTGWTLDRTKYASNAVVEERLAMMAAVADELGEFSDDDVLGDESGEGYDPCIDPDTMEVARKSLGYLGWQFSEQPGGRLRTSCMRDSRLFDLEVFVRNVDTICASCVLPVTVPDERRQAVAEVLVQLSHYDHCGGFAMEPGTGALRFRDGIDTMDGRHDVASTMAMLHRVVSRSETGLAFVMEIIAGEANPFARKAEE